MLWVGAEFFKGNKGCSAPACFFVQFVNFGVPIMRILHVEDDQDTRTLVAFVLESEGWEVVSVEKASPALELAAAGGFDLYLLDNWIEGDTHNVLCRSLRSIDPHTPILFYSGAVFPFEVETALDCGAQGYLEKPCTPEALVAEILKLTRPG